MPSESARDLPTANTVGGFALRHRTLAAHVERLEQAEIFDAEQRPVTGKVKPAADAHRLALATGGDHPGGPVFGKALPERGRDAIRHAHEVIDAGGAQLTINCARDVFRRSGNDGAPGSVFRQTTPSFFSACNSAPENPNSR